MIITLLVSIAVIIGIVAIVSTMPNTGCTGDCNQGRNCTCRSK
jgi:hypothetical protein